MYKVMGIDLGTTNSVVAVVESGTPEIIINAEGNKTTPSVVFYPPDGECVVGELAKRQEIIHPERTIRSIKRFMGCRWEESEEKRRGTQYPLTQNDDGMVVIQRGETYVTPEEISAEILKKMRQAAEGHTGQQMDQAVITVPAYFNDSQRQATKTAAELAGLKVLRIINEPTAAALAYGLGRETPEKVAVFDLGGGTFDVSLLDIDGDVFEVQATAGDNFLGGDNFDLALAEWISAGIEQKTGLDPRGDAQAAQRILDAAEKIKCELSSLTETSINLPFIVADDSGPKHFTAQITRQQFETIIESMLERLRAPCKQVLKDAGLKSSEITTVLLVGGSTRMPRIQRLAAEIFKREPVKSINPDEVVAAGAAIQASIISGDIQEVLLLDVSPLSLGVELEGGLMKILIPRNSSIPTTASRCFTTAADNQRAVTIHVLQGERRVSRENRSLAKFRLTGIRPAPKEVPEIEVTFHIDANGILNVLAEDLSTSQREEITIESASAVSAQEVERMIADAETHHEEDQQFTQQIEDREKAGVLRDQFDDFLKIHGEDIDSDEIEEMNEALECLSQALEAQDPIGLEEAGRAVRDLMQRHSDLFYLHTISAQQTEEAAAQSAASEVGDTDTQQPVAESAEGID
jgi:molecular chaperone DnaK